tara:strand:+ start:613 stop:807 length:195 start_codon:yes stop_codon:yes gene_type:complete
MINENDIVFDNVFEEECNKLDVILKQIAEELKEEGGYSQEILERIIDTWCEGVGIRLREEWNDS